MEKSSKKSYLYFIILPFILPGMLVAAWRCLFRGMAEQKNIYVETVIDFEEMRQLAREEGWKLARLFKAMKENGASSVAISEDTLNSLQSEGRITVLSADEVRKLSIEESLQHDIPETGPGALWVHSQEEGLLDRIQQQLSWKISFDRMTRLHRNFLIINKSNQGFRERVGLGFTEDYLKMAGKAGLGVVIRVFNYPQLSASAAQKLVSSLPSPASVSALLFAEEEMLGARGQLKQIISLFNSRSYRIGWIEFNIQDGIVQYLHLLSETRPFVRVHSISRKEIDQVYDVPRAVARWVRAVKDRSMKMLYIRCFFQDKQRYIADLAQFNLNYLHRTSESLKQNGFVVAQTHNQRLNEPRHMVGVLSSAERIAIALALLMGLVLLLNHSFLLSMDSRWYFAAPVLAVLLFFVLNRESYNALFGLIGAISYSCLGLVLAFNRFKKSSAGFSDQLVFIITLVVPSLIGGLLIAGLHSEIDYLLKFSQFRGIKLAFVVPILFVMLWSFKEFGKGLVELINRPLTPLSASIIGAIAIGFTAYLLRSGNLTALKPSAIEDGFRTFLENTLVARPRNKEFLVGYPAALLFIFFFIRKRVSLLPVLAIFIQMGQVSVVNTLCHFHSPLGLSLLRIFNGFWVGIVVGIPVLLSAMLFYVVSLIGDKKNNSIVLAGYLGFKNFGDELLWQTFCRNLNSDYQIKVLLADESELPKNLSDKAFPLSRSHKFALLESLLTCKAIVFAGGGVFQAKTSFVSLLYYLTLLTITRFSGGQVILMAQGFGPWGIWQKRFPRFFAWLARFLSASDYISVRDNDSADWIESKSDTKIPVTADYVFAEASFSPGKIKKPESVLKVAVILRSSEPESKRIAKIFIRLATETENLQLMPVAFQNGDETVWQNAGWENEVKNYDPAFPAQVFADLDLVVSMRLHGCIIATAKAIPWIGLAYDPKLHAFARQIKWKFCYELEKLDRALIENKMNLLAVKKVELAQKLARYSNELSRRAAKDLQNVVDCLKK